MADYCTTAEVKAQMVESGYNLSGTSSDYDAGIGAQITAVSRLIDKEVGRQADFFSPSSDDATIYYDGDDTCELWIDEFVSITSVSVSDAGGIASSDYTAWSSSDYIEWPYNSTPIMRLDVDTLNGSKIRWDRFRKSVQVVGIRGYSATRPDDINEACIIQTMRWYMRSKQGWQDAGASGDLGQIVVNVNQKSFIGSKLDPDVAGILHPYKIANSVGIP